MSWKELIVPEGPLKKFEFKKGGENYWQEPIVSYAFVTSSGAIHAVRVLHPDSRSVDRGATAIWPKIDYMLIQMQKGHGCRVDYFLNSASPRQSRICRPKYLENRFVLHFTKLGDDAKPSLQCSEEMAGP